MVGSQRNLLILLLATGCSHSSPKTDSEFPKKNPSSWQTLDVRYQPESTIVEPGQDGKERYWVPIKFQETGEEKLLFEQRQGRPKTAIITEPPKIQLIGITSDMEAVREMSRHLVSTARRKTLPVAKYGLAPFGLSSEQYFGHTFWDMDVWMLPALLFLSPESVEGIVKYRLDRAPQAKQNFVEFAANSGSEKEKGAMMFPWESSVTGKEVCQAKTKLQHHISGDVVWGLTQAEAMGFALPSQVNPIAEGVRKFYNWRSVVTNRGREILDVTSPNEKFVGDNDLYTNLLAEWITNSRGWKAKPNYYLPKDSASFLNYDNDPMRDYQQVAGLLSIYPLQYPEAEKQALTMLQRFEPGLSKNGPAMGHSIIATIYARLGQTHKAYRAWKESWAPYLTGQNHLFSERNNVPKTYFYTGAAGALNTVIYGFGGFRLDRLPLKDAKWTKKLKSGWWLSCKPSVPGEIGKIIFNGIQIDDQKYDFEMSSTGGFSAKISTLKG